MAAKKKKEKKKEKEDFRVTVEEKDTDSEKKAKKDSSEEDSKANNKVASKKEEEVKDEEEKKAEESESETQESTDDETGDQEDAPDLPKPPQKDKLSFWSIFFAFLSSLVIGGLLVGGIFYFQSSINDLPVPTTPEPNNQLANATPEPQSTPTPASEVEFVPSDYGVQVLNGTGQSGAAGSARSLLEEGGFTGVEVGNADSFDYEDTVVRLNDTVPESALETIQELMPDYSVAEGEALDTDSEFDIVVITGTTS